MKKNKALEIHFLSRSEMQKKIHTVIASKKKCIQPKHVIYFDELAGFRTFITSQKIELLALLSSAKPKTIYELAKMLGRTFPAVWSDCTALKNMGFIYLMQNKGNRSSLQPKLIFPYTTIKVFLPATPYTIQFSKAS